MSAKDTVGQRLHTGASTPNRHSPPRSVVLAIACAGFLFALSLPGCEATSSDGDEHHHAHSHDHQQRATFPESVAAIRKRSARFVSDQAPGDDSLNAWKLPMLVEIVEKLPEVAADSDLKKAEWDRVDTISKELLVILKPADSALRGTRIAGTSGLEPLIAELEQMVPLSENSATVGLNDNRLK